MAASESTKFQVNFKTPDGTLINLYAANKEELEALLTAAQDFSALIGSVSQSFSGARSVAPVSSGGFAPAPARQQAPAPDGAAPECKHGHMNFTSGVGAKGPWKAWRCAAPQGTPGKCDPIWVR